MTLLNLSKKDEAYLDRIAEASAPALARLYASALRGLARFEGGELPKSEVHPVHPILGRTIRYPKFRIAKNSGEDIVLTRNREDEVDALPAPELRERVADAIKLHLDPMEYQRLQTVEAAERDRLFKRLRRL